jgi:hypothetical protein
LLSQPTGHSAQADDVVAFVVEVVGHEGVGGLEDTGFIRQKQHFVRRDGLVQRGAQFLPVGEQLGDGAWVHHGARQDVRTRLRALFEHNDVDFLAGLFSQLLETNGRGQTARAGADDHDVVFH